jgi:thiamine-monophosphate kinase
VVLRERKLIDRIRNLAGAAAITSGAASNGPVVSGIGDDCAILRVRAGFELLVTTDLCVEDVHFRREWHPARSVGHRCLTRGLSDIAAMGGEPLACFLSLGLPSSLPQSWVDGFLQGLRDLARHFKVQLAGGDISSAPQVAADIVVVGEVPRGKALLRSGARPGDRIYVTGDLGGSAAVLTQLYQGEKVQPAKSSHHFYPSPRIEAGLWMRRRHKAKSMIDLSDGLSVDLAHICEESGVSAIVYADRVPVAKGADLPLALHGGEDYELLFTAPASIKLPQRTAGIKVTEIGLVKKRSNYSSAIQILGENGKVRPLAPLGWEHFRKQS